MPYRKPFNCEIYTPTEHMAIPGAVSVVFATSDGMMGVLGGHAPMVAMVEAGPVTIHSADGGQVELYVGGGFAQIGENSVTLLAEQCLPLDQIDAEEAWAGIQSARKMPTETDAELAHRDRKLSAARAKFRLAQKRRRAQILAKGGHLVEE